MLIFTCGVDEVIALGDPASADPPIEVKIAELAEGKVRLGITAPTEVQVHRSEVWEDIRENGRRG